MTKQLVQTPIDIKVYKGEETVASVRVYCTRGKCIASLEPSAANGLCVLKWEYTNKVLSKAPQSGRLLLQGDVEELELKLINIAEPDKSKSILKLGVTTNGNPTNH